MPSWNQVLQELETSDLKNPLDAIRHSYVKKLADYRGRNVIAYYSGFLQHPGLAAASIDDNDKNGLMAAIHELDRTKGLDLLLHTPGGDLCATESIIDYLYRMFEGNIHAFVPQIAMSAGTMIACSTKKIYMGKQSNLGPIDPQIGGVPAYAVVKEFQDAITAVTENPASIPIWQTLIGKYHPTYVGLCQNAIKMADEMVTRSLERTMFGAQQNAKHDAKSIVDFLNEHENSKMHARHINIDEAKNCGLVIEDLEADSCLQDLVLTVHHCFMHTFSNSRAIKIIENQNENTTVIFKQ